MTTAFQSWIMGSLIEAFETRQAFVQESNARLQVGDKISVVKPLNIFTSGSGWENRNVIGILAAILSKTLTGHMLIYLTPDNLEDGHNYNSWTVYVPEINFDQRFIAELIQEMLGTISKQAYAIKFKTP
jgi:hypothetical protein